MQKCTLVAVVLLAVVSSMVNAVDKITRVNAITFEQGEDKILYEHAYIDL